MRLVDADALTKRLVELCNKTCPYTAKAKNVMCGSCFMGLVLEAVEDAPTIEPERKNVVEIPGTGIGDLSDGYHTFNGLYEQRMVLFAALVKAYKDKAWKSYRHEDGEYCFGGGWFIVGIDTPEGSYTYHYENKYWDMFDCVDLPKAKHWDGHTEEDAETRLMSLEPEPQWISTRVKPDPDLPEDDMSGYFLVTLHTYGNIGFDMDEYEVKKMRWNRVNGWVLPVHSPAWIEEALTQDVLAWKPCPEPYREEGEQE